jgi:hypothetical protein
MADILRKASQILRRKNSDSPHSHVQAQHTQDIPNNNNPSRDTPPTVPLLTSPSQEIPRNILAFRTITKLLSQIQQEREFQVLYTEPTLPSKDRLELRLSNAFSTVAVIEHEVIAVVTKPTHESLQVTACTQTSINQGPLITPLPSGALSQAWHLLVNQNYRRGGAKTGIHPTGEPTISEARILAGIDFLDDEMLNLHVDEYW